MTGMIVTSTPARRVLVVDDVLVNRKLASAMFAKLSWQVTDLDGGIAALDWLASNPTVDLMLLDISMPDLSGEDLCRQLRANPAFAELPIVAYTAHAMQVDIDHFLANGFTAVLIKPITMQNLKDVVAELFPE
jgi:two-component system chemotaxis response regulator CheY